MNHRPSNPTPWGESQNTAVVADGITFHSTARHGGYHLSVERMAAFLQIFPYFETFTGGAWFEEDCDAAMVIVAFPQEFSDQAVYQAVCLIQAMSRRASLASGPCKWDRVSDELTSGANPHLTAVYERAKAFKLAHAEDWSRGSMSTNGRGWTVWFRRFRDGAERVVAFPAGVNVDQYCYTTADLERLSAQRGGAALDMLLALALICCALIAGYYVGRASVNLDARRIADREYVRVVAKVADAYELDPSDIEVHADLVDDCGDIKR